MDSTANTTQATKPPEREEIIALAQRLARREGVAPSWIDYPTWAGIPPGSEAMLKKAADFRDWARAILEGELLPPDWLAREDQVETCRKRTVLEWYRAHPAEPRSAPPRPPAYIETIDFKEAARDWCSAEQKRTAPKPGRREVLELAHLLGDLSCYPNWWVFYPEWASYPEEYGPMLSIARKLRRWAAAILAHQEAPPEYLIRTDPTRWAPPPVVRLPAAERGPARLSLAGGRIRLRALPLAAAFLLRTAFGPAPPGPTRPPPYGRWPEPRRPGREPSRPAAPPEREGDTPTPVRLFGNRIAVYSLICRIRSMIEPSR